MWSRREKMLAAFGLLLVSSTCGVLLPCVRKVSDGGHRGFSLSKIHQIGLAIQNYHEVRGKLPRAVVRDKDGRALYSWRVLLLPYLESARLYSEFHHDEPWDSPHNLQFLKQSPKCYWTYLDGDDDEWLTRFQVVVGPGTAFERDGLTWDDFPDGRESTILVVEADEAVPWTKPTDLVYEPRGPLPRFSHQWSKPVKFLCS